MKRLLTLLLSVVFSALAYGQSSLDVGPDQTICADSITLNASFTGIPGFNTGNYTISNIPHMPETFTGGTSVVMSDDDVEGPFSIGFTFCFLGNTYNQFYIGSNGWVGFSGGPTTFTPAGIPSTAASVPKNCIMGPWEDWHPGIAGGPYISYYTTGTAPFRKLVVSWLNCPMFSCTSTLGTFQIVMHEYTGLVEVHMVDKPNCPAWVGGVGTLGIHDATGTNAYAYPGRNGSAWTTSNESVEFRPDTVFTPIIAWFDLSGTYLGSGASITIPVSTWQSTVYAELINGESCDLGGGPGSADNRDTLNITNKLYEPLETDAGADTTVCNSFLDLSAGMPDTGQTGTWAVVAGAGSFSNPNDPAATWSGLANGVNLASWTLSNGCIDIVDTLSVTYISPLNSYTPVDPEICPGDDVTFTASNFDGEGSFTWNGGDLSGPVNSSTLTVSPASNQTYILSWTDGTCIDTLYPSVSILSPATANAGADINTCSRNVPLNAVDPDSNTGVWTVATGNAVFDDATAYNTVVRSLAIGDNMLVWTINTECGPSSDTVLVTYQPVNISYSPTEPVICLGDSVSLIATANLSGGTFSWDGGDLGVPFENDELTVSPASSQTYTLSWSNGDCDTSISVPVDVIDLQLTDISNDTTIYEGQSVNLQAIANLPASELNYSWDPSSYLSSSIIQNPSSTPTESITYEVTISHALAACSVTDTVRITLEIRPESLYAIPDVFTPNNDGNNDEFRIVTLGDMEIEEFRIYNRWGEMVHNSTDGIWDGSFNGEVQPVGTYIYYVVMRDLLSGDDIVEQGAISLLK